MNPRHALAAAAAALLLPHLAHAQIAFQPSARIPLVGLRPDGVATGDFDGANGVDFAVASGTLSGGGGPDRIEVFRNQGGGTFVAAQTVALGNNVGAAELVAADLDLDGDLDLAVALHGSNAVRVLFNQAGTFVLGGSTPSGGSETRHLAAADLDGDGDVDLAASNRASNDVTIFRNDGAGTFTQIARAATGLEPYDLALADLNGDGRADIAVAAHDARAVNVIFNQGGATFGAFVAIAVPGNGKPAGVVAADLDGDGDVDLATTTDDNDLGVVVVLRNSGAGAFTAQTFASNGVNPDTIVAADLDGDGDLDLAAADEDANLVSVLANQGNAAFGAATTYAVGTTPENLAAADLDGNGSIDVVATNRDSNDVSFLRNASTGGSSTYCATSPNSAGAGTRIASSGSVSIAANTFALRASGAPAGSVGLFYFGSSTAFAPFGNGFRCVGGAVQRLGPPANADANGRVARAVDFTVVPASAIPAGATRYFQYWHRDGAAGAGAFDLSDGLSATFRP